MPQRRSIGIWSIIAGVALNNVAYLVDLLKDNTAVTIMLGTKSVAVIVLGIALILYGMFELLRANPDVR